MEITKPEAFRGATSPTTADVVPDSVALARLVDEVRADRTGDAFSPAAYNRTYHRHNR